ncbi:MAG: hypothetical protein L3J83_01590 [Proteobacteria bacterium]|nr:hypothetical protein [Pseudomonadota bacterium]
MKYKSGKSVNLYDRVVIENGKTPGIVHAIIETADDMKQWGVNEAGLMLESKPFGMLFWPVTEEPAVLFRRFDPEGL